MNNVIARTLLVVVLAATTTDSCSDASTISQQISNQADSFQNTRYIRVINCPTGEVTFELTGKFSIITDIAESQLEIIEDCSDGIYKKHFIYLNENTSYTVTDLEGTTISLKGPTISQ